jgi:hypothetical protein
MVIAPIMVGLALTHVLSAVAAATSLSFRAFYVFREPGVLGKWEFDRTGRDSRGAPFRQESTCGGFNEASCDFLSIGTCLH